MLFSSDVALWLAGQPNMADYLPNPPEISSDGRWVGCAAGLVAITFDGYGMPDTSGPYVAVGVTGGAPTESERTVDVHLVSVLTFGPQDDHTGAEQLTSTVDDSLMALTFPQTIPSVAAGFDTDGTFDLGAAFDGGTHLISLDYSGAPPRFLDRDNARRSVFTASYVVRIARTVF
jgi:hypothetical protein